MTAPLQFDPNEDRTFAFEIGQHYLNRQGDLMRVHQHIDEGKSIWAVKCVKEAPEAQQIDQVDEDDEHTVDDQGFYNSNESPDVWDLVPGVVETPEELVYRLTHENESLCLDRATLLEENVQLRQSYESRVDSLTGQLHSVKNDLAHAKQEHLDLGKSHQELASHNYDLCRKMQEMEKVIATQKDLLSLETQRRKEMGEEAKTWQRLYDRGLERIHGMQEVAIELANTSRLYRTLLGDDAEISVEK